MKAPTERLEDLIRIVLEVEAGLRPVRHLRPFIHPDLQPALASILDVRGPVRRLRKVTAQRVGDRIEAVALLDIGAGWTEALVVSLERDDGRWTIADLGRPGRPRTPPPVITSVLTMRRWSTRCPDMVDIPVAVPDGWRRVAA